MAFIESFRTLLREEIKPVNNNIEELKVSMTLIQNTLKDVMNTADKSYSMAESAITKAKETDKCILKLEAALKSAELKHNQLHEHMLRIESQSRRDNLRFDGIKEERSEVCMEIIQETIRNMDIDVDQIRIIPAKQKSTKTDYS